MTGSLCAYSWIIWDVCVFKYVLYKIICTLFAFPFDFVLFSCHWRLFFSKFKCSRLQRRPGKIVWVLEKSLRITDWELCIVQGVSQKVTLLWLLLTLWLFFRIFKWNFTTIYGIADCHLAVLISCTVVWFWRQQPQDFNMFIKVLSGITTKICMGAVMHICTSQEHGFGAERIILKFSSTYLTRTGQ